MFESDEGERRHLTRVCNAAKLRRGTGKRLDYTHSNEKAKKKSC